jgi:hypothetical protein
LDKIASQTVVSKRARPYMWLFVSMMGVLLLTPLVLGNRFLLLALSLVYLRALVLTLAERGMRAETRIALWALWLAALGLKLAAPDSIDGSAIYVASRLCTVVLLVACAGATMRHVLLEAEVTIDSIFAAIVAYLLVALAFSAAYSALYAIAPASFSFPAGIAIAESGAADLQTTYFSFVTIATLGYGDITPRLPFAQMLVVTEAMFGQFYVAVVIAWLVSMHAGRRAT